MPLNLGQLSPGDRIQNELRVVSRDNRRTRDGKPFVVLTLGNSSGEIPTAPVWSENLNWVEGAERGAIVQAIGEVSVYQDGARSRRQVRLEAPLRVVDPSLVKLEEFLPRIEDDTETLWAAIDRYRGEIRSDTLRRVVGLFFDDDAFRERFERWPGSTRGHHAKIGGLLRHVAEVTAIARTIAQTMKVPDRPIADRDLAVAGALLHDVGKVEAYSVGPTGFDTTTTGHLIGHVVLGVLMLQERIDASPVPVCSREQLLEIQHLILSHHGTLEFGSPVRPMTIEADIVHWADESSAKPSSFADAMADESLFQNDSELSDRVWSLDQRRVWRKKHQW